MIIMRALVATVLLIVVMLVSIVLINANTRPVQSASGSQEEYSAEEAPTKGKSAVIKEVLDKDLDPEELESIEHVVDLEDGDGHHVILERVSEELPQDDEKIVIKKSETDTSSAEKYDEETHEIFVEIDPDKSVEEIILIPKGTTSGDDLLFSDSTDDNGSSTKSESLKSTKVEAKPRTKTTAQAKESTTTHVPKTETDGPLGYERESYIILDTEPPEEADETSGSAEIDPINSSGSVTLERKQRDASGIPETIVMNRVPIVPYIRNERRHSCPHAFPPSHRGRLVKRADPSFPRVPANQEQLEPSALNPYNWDKQNMNMLRFPQCAACKKKAVPVCRTCGKCSECCRHSGCTCGCLNNRR